MLSKFKGLPTDTSIIDIYSAGIYNSEGTSHEHDSGHIFLDPYIALSDDLHSNLMIAPLNQDISKTFASPKRFSHTLSATPFHQKGLVAERSLSKEENEEQNLTQEDRKTPDSSDSNSESAKKRGKYKTYSDNQKNQIIEFALTHGIQKALEMFSGNEHKITKRKLKSWVDGLNKVKGVKGRKSNDPARDQALNKWCLEFQDKNGRPPSRKEATQKALELNGDPNFMASKGWLDKFSRKFKIEFTPLKIIPPRGTKKVKTTTDVESNSVLSSTDSNTVSPLLPSKASLVKAIDSDQKGDESRVDKDKESVIKMNPLFSLTQQLYQQPQQIQQQQPQQQQNHMHSQMSMSNPEGSFSTLENSLYQQFPQLDTGHPQNFPYPIFNPLDYSMSHLNYQGLPYGKGYPVNCRTPYPMAYQPNLPINFQAGLAENFQQFQKFYKHDEMKFEKL